MEIAESGLQNLGELFRRKGEGHDLKLIDSELLFDVEDGAGVIKIEHNIGMGFGVIALAVDAIQIDEIVDGGFDVVGPIVALKMDAGLFRNFTGSFPAGRFFNRLFGAGAGGQRENHQQSKEHSQNFFHSDTPYVFCHSHSV